MDIAVISGEPVTLQTSEPWASELNYFHPQEIKHSRSHVVFLLGFGITELGCFIFSPRGRIHLQVFIVKPDVKPLFTVTSRKIPMISMISHDIP